MNYTIDRFEGDQVVLETEDGSFLTIAKKRLPQNAKEGDILYSKQGEFFIDQEATKTRASRIAEKMARLFED